MLLATTCPCCRRPGRAPCAACAAAVLRAPEPWPGEAGVEAVLTYQGAGRRMLLALKYANAKPVARSLASAMARRARRHQVDVVTWAPTSAARRRARSYDQAEVLARAVAWRLGVPCRRLLRRTDGGPPQTGRSRADRLEGPAFEARRRVRGAVLVVDDVVTTGATLRAADAALRGAGADTVHCIAAAATP